MYNVDEAREAYYVDMCNLHSHSVEMGGGGRILNDEAAVRRICWFSAPTPCLHTVSL